MIDLYSFIHKQREQMNKELDFLIKFIYNEADLKEVGRDSYTKICSTSTDKDDRQKKIQTGIRWLKNIDAEEKLGCKNHTGKEYAVMFPQSYLESENDLQLIIVSREDVTVDIVSPYPGVNQTIKVKATDGHIVSVPSNFTSWFNETYSKGIFVKSNKQISVYGATQGGSSIGEAFMAIPTRFLSRSYYAASYNYTLAVVVALDDHTILNKTYNMPFGNMTLQRNLSRLKIDDSVSLERTSIQLTSNKVIGVIASSRCFVQFSGRKHGTSWKFCTQLLSYIPPIQSLGNVFIIPQTTKANSSLVHIESDWKNNCFVSLRSAVNNETANFTINHQYELRPELPYVMETSLPSVAVLFIGHPKSSHTASVLIPSIRQYSNHYKFITPFEQNFNHSVIIMIKNINLNGLKLDGEPVLNLSPHINNIFVKDTLYNVLSLNISAGMHDVNHVENGVTFGLLAIGFSDSGAYGFPVGLYLGEENCTNE